MSHKLVNRERELDALRQLASGDGSALGLLYGRRRVGKTYLLDRTWPDRRVFYFLAADSTPSMNRLDLVRDLAEWSERELDPDDYPTWRTVFRLFVELARQRPLIVILDEFQYLLGGDDDAASQLIAVWDREVEGLPLTLVLCGSEVSTMERLRAADRPLYGRVDWSHRLEPFDYLDASRMVPDRAPREAARVYGIFGGTPQYLSTIEAGQPLAHSVCQALLRPGGPVRVQVETIVEQEKGIRKPAEYRAVLTAVARGRTEKNEIATAVGMEGSTENIRRILERLEDLGLVWREQNFDAPPNAVIRYRISDNAVRFWHRYVDANRSLLAREDPREVWRTKIEPNLDAYTGKVFEQICREAFLRRHDEWGLAGATDWARWEGTDRNRQPIEIDIAAHLADGTTLTGEAKWSSEPVGPGLHTGLVRKLEALAGSGQGWAHGALPEMDSARFLYVSAAGFTEAFHALAGEERRIVLVDLEGLYAGRE